MRPTRGRSNKEATRSTALIFKDLEHNTAYGAQPDGSRKVRWLFRHPAPVNLARIRATMRRTLERFVIEKGLGKTEADALRDAFDAHLDLLEVPLIDRTQVFKLPSTWDPGVPTPPPPTRKDDET